MIYFKYSDIVMVVVCDVNKMVVLCDMNGVFLVVICKIIRDGRDDLDFFKFVGCWIIFKCNYFIV